MRPPALILTANIWRDGNHDYTTPDLTTLANLAWGLRVNTEYSFTDSTMSLLLPKLTDIRGYWNNQQGDRVEVPAGTKRFYRVIAVDDQGKGFPNEHRIAVLSQFTTTVAAFGFPFPVPLP